MSIINSQPLIGASGNQVTGYNLTRSLRFRSSASAYLNRTPSTTSGTQKYTISVWFKRGNFGAYVNLIGASCPNPPFGNTFDGFRFNNSDQLEFAARGGNDIYVVPSMVFRDPAAWYHVVVAVDTTQATASNRVKFYVNGVLQTAFASATYPSQNYNMLGWNVSGNAHSIGSDPASLGTSVCDSYMAEINVISGSQELHTAFGETDTATGVWKPKKYTGTYGTNGFYLKFDNLTSTSTLGNDSSGNSNTWTVNNISLTSGATYDSMKDVPTLTDADTANYCVMNPTYAATSVSYTNGNLQYNFSSGSSYNGLATIGVTSGKWYYEVQPTASTGGSGVNFLAGFWSASSTGVGYPTYYWDVGNYGGINAGIEKSSGTNTGVVTTAFAQNDICGVALDYDAGTIEYYKNGSSIGKTTGMTINGVTLFPVIGVWSGSYTATTVVNFGQRPFSYTPPSGFKALNTFNLPTPTIGATASTQANKYFDINTYTGDGSQTASFTNSGSMQPDLVWSKIRSGTTQGIGVFDSVRGTTGQSLDTAATTAEGTWNGALSSEYGYVSAFNSNGFSVNDGSVATTGGYVNFSGRTYVAWQWRASNTTAVTNTAGSITSTVSVNTTAGFSIVTYTGTGSNATVGHGLGATPAMIIIKNRSAAVSWPVWHKSFPSNQLYLNLTNALDTPDISSVGASTFAVDTWSGVNGSGNGMVAYCWAEIAGYSAFGKYTGNGSTDGTFVYTGFRPKFILRKRTDTTAYWVIGDSVRNSYNLTDLALYPNDSLAESSDNGFDILSNGFKIRSGGANINASGGTYIYAAFAENPFKYSLAR
jgi:hypothetical protein